MDEVSGCTPNQNQNKPKLQNTSPNFGYMVQKILDKSVGNQKKILYDVLFCISRLSKMAFTKTNKIEKWTALFIPIFKDIQLYFWSNEDSSTLKLFKYTLSLAEEMHHVSKVWRRILQFWFILNFDNCENTCVFWSQNICSVNNKKKVNGHYVL